MLVADRCQDLIKDGGLDEDNLEHLHAGLEAAKSVCDRADEAIAREERQAALAEIQSRVEDWKGHRIEHFGELLLHGQYLVIKGEGAKEVEREYKIYLFERILLCCKEINPNKPKNRIYGNNKPLLDKQGKPKLQLKGRIFMQNVTDVISVVKPGTYAFGPLLGGWLRFDRRQVFIHDPDLLERRSRCRELCCQISKTGLNASVAGCRTGAEGQAGR